MSHVTEPEQPGRARCRTCKRPIAKGELRAAVERPLDTRAFVGASAGHVHPRCAAAHTGDPLRLFAALRANSRALPGDDLVRLAASI